MEVYLLEYRYYARVQRANAHRLSAAKNKPGSPKPKNPRYRRAGNYLADTRVLLAIEWKLEGKKAKDAM